MKLYDDIKEKEPQTRMILDLQKVCRSVRRAPSYADKCLAMYPKGTQKYVAPSYAEVTDEKMRNYKKILHQSQWEVQSKLSVIKVRDLRVYLLIAHRLQTYASKPLAMDKIVNLARTAKDMQIALVRTSARGSATGSHAFVEHQEARCEEEGGQAR